MLTHAGVWGQAVLSTMNVGNCAVYYSWSRVQVGVEAARDKLQVLLSLNLLYWYKKSHDCFASTPVAIGRACKQSAEARARRAPGTLHFICLTST